VYKKDIDYILKKIEKLNSRNIKLDSYNDDDYNLYDNIKLVDQKESSNENKILNSYKAKISDCEFELYFIKLDSVPIMTFDENYNMIPKNTIIQYEVGININYQKENNKFVNINGLNRFLSPNKELVDNKYQELEQLLKSNDLNKILKKINDDLDMKITEKKIWAKKSQFEPKCTCIVHVKWYNKVKWNKYVESN